MSSGLLALLDDVAALVKVTAASLDDVPAQVAKTSGKVSGIVIDDAAVTPKYVVGLDPSRELAIIANIGKRSLVNKLVLLAPAALLMGTFAPWLITPILMVGGAYLCFEGYEKVHGMLHPHAPVEEAQLENITPEALEKLRTDGAVKTDFILSAEIMAITYATVADKDMATQVMVLISIAIGITVAVYGFVGLVVKMDDIGLYIAKNASSAGLRKAGRGLVKAMPPFLKILGMIGTAAMLWVGAEIIAHGVPLLHHGLEWIGQALAQMPVLAWLAKASACALGGLIIGFIIEKILTFVRSKKLL
jgi:predicted DNA repair protein MutK